MQVKGIGWLGTRTERFDEMVAFYRDILGLRLAHHEPDFAVFRCANGDIVEVFGTGNSNQSHFTTGPVAGFTVDDVAAGRAELEAAGIAFISETRTVDDYSWSHFRGPDGNVYELSSVPPPG